MADISAEKIFQEALRVHRAGRLVEAERLYREALAQKGDHCNALDGLGLLVLQVGAAPAAVGLFARAIAINPRKLSYHVHLSMALSAQGQLEESIAVLNRAMPVFPNNPEFYFHLGNVLQQGRRIEDSIAAYKRSIALQPNSAEAYNNLGAAYRRGGRDVEAMDACRQAIKLRPDFADAHANLGNALQEKGRTNEALGAFRRALALNPNSNEAKVAIGMIFLREGNFAKGWPAYEARLARGKIFTGPDLPQPRWDGSALNGRRILLRAEQGLGDTMHFVRYAALLNEGGGRVLLQCQPELQRLLRGKLGVEQVLAKGEPLPAFDVHLPLMSLPGVMGTTLETIPANVPYLEADPVQVGQWSARLRDYAGMWKVGLVWSGSSTNKSDHLRSMSLEMFAPLSAIGGVRMISLQKGPSAQQAKALPTGMSIIDWTEDLRDFADTAALVANLDLVITVDTSVAHLAGAMGKPIWTLITAMPDWRWMMNRENSPWYPTMRLFRQTAAGDWLDVIRRVERELLKEAGKRDSHD